MEVTTLSQQQVEGNQPNKSIALLGSTRWEDKGQTPAPKNGARANAEGHGFLEQRLTRENAPGTSTRVRKTELSLTNDWRLGVDKLAGSCHEGDTIL